MVPKPNDSKLDRGPAMNRSIGVALASCMLIATFSTPTMVRASELIAACKVEIDESCSDVSVGQGRITACLFARNHKLSPDCKAAVTRLTNGVPESVASMKGTTHEARLQNACRRDVRRLCSDVSSGTRFVLACLYSRSQNLSEPCMDVAKVVLNKLW
jgi:hypothetical protein